MGDFQKTFGLLIAWLIPGGVALFGAFQWAPIDSLYRTAIAKQDIGQAGSLALLTGAAFAFGLLISSWREQILERLLRHISGVTFAPLRMASLINPDRLSLYVWVQENSYRFYQHKANLMLALVVVLCFHWLELLRIGTWIVRWDFSLFYAIALVTLWFAAVKEYRGYGEKIGFAT